MSEEGVESGGGDTPSQMSEGGEESGGGGGGGGGGGRGGGGGGGGVGGSSKEKAAKALLGAMAGTTTTVLITTELIEDSLHPALAVAYAALFLTTFLFLAILAVILLCAPGSVGGGAVKFAGRSAIAVMFVVPLLALPMKVYAVLDKKARSRSL